MLTNFVVRLCVMAFYTAMLARPHLLVWYAAFLVLWNAFKALEIIGEAIEKFGKRGKEPAT